MQTNIKSKISFRSIAGQEGQSADILEKSENNDTAIVFHC